MSYLAGVKNYSLVICEKPDAAKRIFQSLDSEGKGKSLLVSNIPVYVAGPPEKPYVICSAIGHLYAVSDPSRRKSIFPVFDVEWFPRNVVEDDAAHVEKRLNVISQLATRAVEFVEATDFDIEGETIGYNILRYACNGKQDEAKRAKFSTLTTDELRESFRNARPNLGRGLAKAGRTRHVVDFIWGINLSRALSESVYLSTSTYKMVSMGRVQGPTLAFVVNREVEVRSFVPAPYWSVGAYVDVNGKRVFAPYEKDKVLVLSEAQDINRACEGKVGKVSQLKKSTYREVPPTPLNIGDLQKEAYRVFRFYPSQTLRIAERLYLDALISYPRTSSQKLPAGIGYSKIIRGLGAIPNYKEFAQELLERPLKPHEGEKEDEAHPAIYPTGEHPKGRQDSREAKIFDLIIRRFLAVFGKNSVRERISARVDVEGFIVKLNGRRTISLGWVRYYRPYTETRDVILPGMEEGQPVQVVSVEVQEKMEQPPPRYNRSSLLDKMERERMGTKATRADIIDTLYERGYVNDESMSATDVGFTVIETMKEHTPDIISTELTRDIEQDLEAVAEEKADERAVIEKAIDKISDAMMKLRADMDSVGSEIRKSVVSTMRDRSVLGKCPVCGDGNLILIRSKTTKKRFVGCSNYKNGCKASAPLPQRGFIKIPKKQCPSCGWPIVYVRGLSRFPWKLCVNVSCPAKEKTKNTEINRT